MLNHVMVGSNDIERSRRFYNAVLATLGAGDPVRNEAASGRSWPRRPLKRVSVLRSLRACYAI